MIVAQQRPLARRLAGQQAIRTLGIESQHPVPNNLMPDSSRLRRLAARAALVDHGKRQQTPSLPGVARPTSQNPQVFRRVISPKRNILGLRHDPKFSWVYNAEIISDRIA